MDAYDHELLSYTDLKVEKMVQGSGVSVEGRHLLGLLTIFGKRNAEAFNYLTINNDGTYAHAGTAFFNDSHSAGFKLTEADFDNTFSLKEAPGIADINAISTFSAPYATVVPANVTAWFVNQSSQVHDFVISMTKIPAGQAIPANTGVLLTGNADSYKFVPAGNEEEAHIENNMLVGTGKTSVEVDAAVNAYVLGKSDDVVAFYPLSASNRTIEKHKAYLILPASMESVKLYFDFDFNATAIFIHPKHEAVAERPSVGYNFMPIDVDNSITFGVNEDASFITHVKIDSSVVGEVECVNSMIMVDAFDSLEQNFFSVWNVVAVFICENENVRTARDNHFVAEHGYA
jgi:hypothetical protein